MANSPERYLKEGSARAAVLTIWVLIGGCFELSRYNGGKKESGTLLDEVAGERKVVAWLSTNESLLLLMEHQPRRL